MWEALWGPACYVAGTALRPARTPLLHIPCRAHRVVQLSYKKQGSKRVSIDSPLQTNVRLSDFSARTTMAMPTAPVSDGSASSNPRTNEAGASPASHEHGPSEQLSKPGVVQRTLNLPYSVMQGVANATKASWKYTRLGNILRTKSDKSDESKREGRSEAHAEAGLTTSADETSPFSQYRARGRPHPPVRGNEHHSHHQSRGGGGGGGRCIVM
ncbi:hypothetical protein BV25DRAFT_1241402 [Artomyces pyxidatus]|uniref:Uncharacterized protein n=1 Tax=Artomyces pyxidatus TaxID=48021 RepID=A0ACB8TEA4_9AGAM|nr:hypothetical protein BV25DRAFT_1241402 [Artomyces pyxidatus]